MACRAESGILVGSYVPQRRIYSLGVVELDEVGKTLAVCVGSSMNTYNYGINGYHFSMHRGTTGLGNVRRVGPGLKLLMSGADPCPTPGKAYRVAIGKVGPTIFLVVDGKLIHSYTDAATHGPILTRATSAFATGRGLTRATRTSGSTG